MNKGSQLKSAMLVAASSIMLAACTTINPYTGEQQTSRASIARSWFFNKRQQAVEKRFRGSGCKAKIAEKAEFTVRK